MLLSYSDYKLLQIFAYSWFAHDVISSFWAPSWLILQITLAVYSEIVGSISYFMVNWSVLWILILKSEAQWDQK